MNAPAESLPDEEFNTAAMTADPNPEKALYWLAYYAEEIGNAYGRMKHKDLNRKTVRAYQYWEAKGTNKDREMIATCSGQYLTACEEFKDACAEYMRLSVLREAAVLKVGVWQSKVKAGIEGNP